jgi:hypothetical protein
MLNAINNWTPQYPKGFGFLFFRLVYITYKPGSILSFYRQRYFKAALNPG